MHPLENPEMAAVGTMWIYPWWCSFVCNVPVVPHRWFHRAHSIHHISNRGWQQQLNMDGRADWHVQKGKFFVSQISFCISSQYISPAAFFVSRIKNPIKATLPMEIPPQWVGLDTSKCDFVFGIQMTVLPLYFCHSLGSIPPPSTGWRKINTK